VWRRQLKAWEDEMLGECHTLLSPVTLQVESPDRRQVAVAVGSCYVLYCS
jgi:hypothetical protein